MNNVHHLLARPLVGDDFYFNFFREKIEMHGCVVVVSPGVSPETQNFLSSHEYVCWGGEGVYQFIKSGSKPPKDGIHYVYTFANEEEWDKLLKRVAAEESIVDVKKSTGYWSILTKR